MKDLAKFRWPAVLIALGILIIVFGLASGQDTLFLFGGITTSVAGVIALVSALNVVNRAMKLVLTLVLFGLIALLGFQNFMVIKKPLDFMAERDARYVFVEQRLKDIRQMQFEYKKANGLYCSDLDSLLHFVKYDSVIVLKASGEVPDTLTELQALQRNIITRDTVLIPAFGEVFNDKYLTTRKPDIPLVVDSLPYVPFGGGARFQINAGEVDRGNAMVPVFEVVDTKPFDKDRVLKVGSMTDPSTSGNWE